MQHPHRQADGLCVLPVERIQKQIPAKEHDRHADKKRDNPRLRDVSPRHAQHVAEQDMVEMHLGLNFGVEQQAEPEHAGEDHAHDRVFLHTAVFFQVTDAHNAGHAGHESADGKRYADNIGNHHARQHRMAHGIAHQRPAL